MAEISNLTDAAFGWEGAVSGAVSLCKMMLILSDWDYIKSIFRVYFILCLSLLLSGIFLSASSSAHSSFVLVYENIIAGGHPLFNMLLPLCFMHFSHDVEQDTYFIDTIYNLL